MFRVKDKGTRFETHTARYLAAVLGEPDVDRAAPHGENDVGDIVNLTDWRGRKVVVECKDRRQLRLAEGLSEAVREAKTAGTSLCIAVFHRPGSNYRRHGVMAAQYAVLPTEVWYTLINDINHASSFPNIVTAIVANAPGGSPAGTTFGWPSAKKILDGPIPSDDLTIGYLTRLPGSNVTAVVTTLHKAALALHGGKPLEAEP